MLVLREVAVARRVSLMEEGVGAVTYRIKVHQWFLDVL